MTIFTAQMRRRYLRSESLSSEFKTHHGREGEPTTRMRHNQDVLTVGIVDSRAVHP